MNERKARELIEDVRKLHTPDRTPVTSELAPPELQAQSARSSVASGSPLFSMTPHEYLKIETEQNAVIASAHRTIGAAREAVDPKPPVEQLRRAEAADIRPGLIVWHDNGDEGWFWHVVMEPRHYGDDFKAYVADDGSRYGLRGAWVYANAVVRDGPLGGRSL